MFICQQNAVVLFTIFVNHLLYRNIVSKDSELQDSKKETASLWGSVASFILVTKWAEAEEMVIKVSDNIDAQRLSKHVITKNKLSRHFSDAIDIFVWSFFYIWNLFNNVLFLLCL